jgi:hypothetical protein
MTPLSAISDIRRERARSEIQTYARMTGLFILVSFGAVFAGKYCESWVIVWNDAAATAANVKTLDFLFRLNLTVHLVQVIADTVVALTFYVILRPVSRNLALLSAFFGLLSAATFIAAQMFYFSAPHVFLSGADYLKAFSPEQLNALAMASQKVFAQTNTLMIGLWGIAWILRGYLIVRSGYVPWILGVFLMLAGVGCIVRNLTLVLAPEYSAPIMIEAFMPGVVLVAVWLLIRGVRRTSDLRSGQDDTAHGADPGSG